MKIKMSFRRTFIVSNGDDSGHHDHESRCLLTCQSTVDTKMKLLRKCHAKKNSNNKKNENGTIRQIRQIKNDRLNRGIDKSQ